MPNPKVIKALRILEDRSKVVGSYNLKELNIIQDELDDISETMLNDKKYDEYNYRLYEVQARLYLLQGKYADAEKWCDEAIRLFGAQYPDAAWLKSIIAQKQANALDISWKESTIKELTKEKDKYVTYLVFAGLALFIAVLALFGTYNSGDSKSEMIDTCVSELSDASDTINSLNGSLDTISSDASSASGGEYDELSSALDEISTQASDAKQDGPTTECEQPVGDDTSSN